MLSKLKSETEILMNCDVKKLLKSNLPMEELQVHLELVRRELLELDTKYLCYFRGPQGTD